jgi:hypothetical protein
MNNPTLIIKKNKNIGNILFRTVHNSFQLYIFIKRRLVKGFFLLDFLLKKSSLLTTSNEI